MFFVCRPFIFAADIVLVEKRAKKNVNRLFQNQENIGSIEKPFAGAPEVWISAYISLVKTARSYGTSRPSVITGICAIRCALRLCRLELESV